MGYKVRQGIGSKPPVLLNYLDVEIFDQPYLSRMCYSTQPAPIGLSLQILCPPNVVSIRLLILQLGLRPFSRHPAVDFILPRLDEHRLSRFKIWFIIVLGQLLLHEPFYVLVPIFHPMKMPRMLRIMEDLEEDTFRLGSHSIEAGFEVREELINVLRSDSDADMETDTME